MNIPPKILKAIEDEALKYARFSWYQGWEKSSGYIKSELFGEHRYGSCRLYIKWEKKKEPTKEQIESEIKKHIQSLLNNEQHHSNQKDFRHYLLDTYFVDVKRLKHEAILSVCDSLTLLISVLEKSEDFVLPKIQGLHNDLKNLEAGINDHEALEKFLDAGKKRVGEE